MAVAKFDSREMCHHHTCQRQGVANDPGHLCKPHRDEQTRVDFFLSKVKGGIFIPIPEGLVSAVQTFITATHEQAKKAPESIKGTLDCYLCANCRRVYAKPTECCQAINLLHIETKSIVYDKLGGIIECRQTQYPIAKR